MPREKRSAEPKQPQAQHRSGACSKRLGGNFHRRGRVLYEMPAADRIVPQRGGNGIGSQSRVSHRYVVSDGRRFRVASRCPRIERNIRTKSAALRLYAFGYRDRFGNWSRRERSEATSRSIHAELRRVARGGRREQRNIRRDFSTRNKTSGKRRSAATERSLLPSSSQYRSLSLSGVLQIRSGKSARR